MGHAAHEAKALDLFAIDFEQRFSFFRFTRKSARREYAAVMRSIERRCTVRLSLGEGHTALPNHAIEMIARPGNELPNQVARLLVAEPVGPRPELFLPTNLFQAV